MTSTHTLAERAAIYANAARAGHRPSASKAREAIRLRALALIQDIRRSGGHVSRTTERALKQ